MAESTTAEVKKSTWKVFGIIIAVAALIGTLFYFFFPHLNMKAVKTSISEFAKTADNPEEITSLEYILLQGVNEIRWRRSTWLQVKKVAQMGNLPIETVIVDAAIAQARDYGYIS